MNLKCNSNNDVYVSISHARAGLSSRVLQSKILKIKICSVQFNLAMERKIDSGTQTLKFNLIELDKIEEVEKYPREFQLVFEIDYMETGK